MRVTATHTFFYAGVFGNFFRVPVTVEVPDVGRVACRSSEQAFMVLKAWTFGDLATLDAIAKAVEPQAAKDLGREVAPFDEATWVAVREDRMYRACLAKFEQNEALRAQLLATGDTILVEASARDAIWGIGLGMTDDRILDERNWRGLNLLGRVLTRVRATLRDRQAARRSARPGRINIGAIASRVA